MINSNFDVKKKFTQMNEFTLIKETVSDEQWEKKNGAISDLYISYRNAQNKWLMKMSTTHVLSDWNDTAHIFFD